MKAPGTQSTALDAGAVVAVTPDASQASAADPGDVCRVEDEMRRYADNISSDIEYDERGAWASKQAAALLPPEQAEAAVGEMAIAVRDALVAEDFAAVARYVKHRRGICLRASKGGPCQWMPVGKLRSCARQKRKVEWEEDTGADELPRYTCREAFREIFLENPGIARATPGFNCFRQRPDNNSASLFSKEPAVDIYVEFFADEIEPVRVGDEISRYRPWRSLWLLFEKRGEHYRLAGLTSHYWGI